MKRFLFIFIGLILSFQLFAYNGIISGEGKLKVASTKWFDIIYPEASKEAASILFERADGLMEEITSSLGIEPDFRMPVVITPGTEQFNAYFTTYPYNHIVLYDTGLVTQLEVFSETVCSTFKHELTHAVTFNMKSPAFKAVSKVFGDSFSAANFIVSSGMAEGATLCSEAATGEGRLNNTISMLPVIQAKLENDLPGYFDVTGVSTIYPTGSFYQFNGAFHNWLQKKYGMEKYADFWYSAVNLGGDSTKFTIGQVFKKVYGLSLNSAWEICFSEYPVPEIPGNPVAAGIAKDFFKPAENNYSINNKNGALYSSLCKTEKGLFYFDKDSFNVYFISDFEKVSPKSILNFDYLQTISASEDGRFIVLNYYTLEGANYKKRIAVYDFEKKQLVYVNENGYQNGTIIKNQDEYYLVSQKFKSQNYELNTKKLILKKNKLIDFEDVSSLPFSFEEAPVAITQNGKNDGTFAFLKKKGLNYSICTGSINNGNTFTQYDFPKGYIVQNLCYDGDRLLFTYANSSSMARVGFLDTQKNEFEFDKRDLSGGIFFPVRLNENEIGYIGQFYRCNRLLKIDCDKGDRLTCNKKTISLSSENPAPESSVLAENLEKLNEASKNYNQFSNYLKGVLLPTCNIQSLSFDPAHFGGNYANSLGLTYITSNPWDGNLIQLSAGYGLETNSGAFSLAFSSESWVSAVTELEVEFDKDGFKQTNDTLILTKPILAGNHSLVQLQSQSMIHFGRSNLNSFDYFENIIDHGYKPGCAASSDKTNYLYGQQVLSLGFQNIIYTQPGLYNRFGYAAVAYGLYRFNSKADFSTIYQNGFDGAFSFDFYIPQLLPWENVQGFTYNLPVVIGVNTLGIKNDSSELPFVTYDELLTTSDFDGFNFGISSVLFASEIQKSLFNATGLFIRDLNISLNYKAGFDINAIIDGPAILYVGEYLKKIINNEETFGNKLYVRAKLNMAPNIGSLGSAIGISLFGDAGIYFENDSAVSPMADFGLTITY